MNIVKEIYKDVVAFIELVKLCFSLHSFSHFDNLKMLFSIKSCKLHLFFSLKSE